MSAPSVRIFGCPTCGFRVDTSEETCPRCGNDFKKGTLFECPFCGDLVPSGLDQCPSCHVSYSEFKERAAPKATDDSIDSLLMEIIKLESTTVREEKKRFSCPQCDLLLEGDETECPRCGKKLDVEVALQCPVCGALVGAKDIKCGECGTVFDEVAHSAAMTEEAESKLEEIMSMSAQEASHDPSAPESAAEADVTRGEEVEYTSEMLSKDEGQVEERPAIARASQEPRPAQPESTPEPPRRAPSPAPQKKASSGAPKRTRKLKAKPAK